MSVVMDRVYDKKFDSQMIQRGDIFYCDLSPSVGSEQGSVRPCIVISNAACNRFSQIVIVAAITSQIQKAKLPTHVEIEAKYGLSKPSVILLEQVRTISKERLGEKVGSVDSSIINRVDQSIAISLGLSEL